MSSTEVPKLSQIPIGACVSLTTGVQYRYEGIVAGINSIEDTITLKTVRFWGSENRISGNTHQNGDNKGPAVGSLFDSVTFWMSSVIQLHIVDESVGKNKLSDNAVKAASSTEANRTQTRKPNVPVADSASSSRNSRRASNNRQSSRSGNQSGQQQPQKRKIVPFNRRGRNSMAQRQPYFQLNAVPTPPNVNSRNNYIAPVRGLPYRMANSGRQNRINRRSGPLNGDGRRPYPQGSGNTGMFVYLPPEVAAAYQPHALPILPHQVYSGPVGNGRRRTNDRRTGLSRTVNNTKTPDVDCTTPYDFETANAELEAELAKINLNADSSEDHDFLSSGDRQINSTNADASTYTGSAAGSGASGDSSTTINPTDGGTTHSTDQVRTLAKGEFYVREKCFFDQISRSEGGPRGPTGGIRGNFNTDRNRFTTSEQSRQSNFTGNSRSNYLPSVSTARRERQLNIETFGQIATRNIYNQRRRPTGSVPRDLLVSATA